MQKIWKMKYLFWTAIHLAKNYIIIEGKKEKTLVGNNQSFLPLTLCVSSYWIPSKEMMVSSM